MTFPKLILISLLLLPTPSRADDKEKPDPKIQAVIAYFAKHNIKLEKAKEWGWHVTDPKPDGYYVLVNFKSFPDDATEEAMNKQLQQIALAHMLNAPAKLAMSHPGYRADAPGTPKHEVPKDNPVLAKMTKLFMAYRPGDEKKDPDKP